MKCKKIHILLLIITLSTGFASYKHTKENQKIEHIQELLYKMERDIKYERNRRNSKLSKQMEQAHHLASREAQRNIMLEEWSSKLGFKVSKVVPITCNLSFYSSLPCENGKYGLKTSSGVDLNNQTIANNQLEFFTNVYMEGLGLKEVQDRGSSKYFSSVSNFDVYVPKEPYENDDDEYLNRVNNMGRKTVQGWIIE